MLDELGLVQADGRLHEGVVEGIADGADRGCDAGLDERFGEGDGRVLGLTAGVGVDDDPSGGEASVLAAPG